MMHEPYAWPGGYPVVWLTKGGDCLCSECADDETQNTGKTLEGMIHWEGTPMNCDECGKEIESAYGEPE